MALADQIKRRRLEQGLTLAELARRANVSKGYLHRMENESNAPRPSADVLFRIAFALGTTVGDLLEKQLPTPENDLTNIPDSLREFAIAERLSDDDIRMLAQIRYRGEHPRSVDDWKYLYESIKRTILRSDGQ